MEHLKFLIEYSLVRMISWFISLIPFQWALNGAKPIGALLFHILKRPSQMATQNLMNAFPEKSEKEITAITKGSFTYLAEFGVEWLMLPQMIKHPKRYLIEAVPGGEEIRSELKKKKGALVLVTHSANQEIMALIMGSLIKSFGSQVYAVARPLKNPHLYRHAVKLRAGQSLQTIDKSGGVRETFNRLKKENAVVCILIDQRVSEGSIETKFFGRPALTTSLPIIAALRLETPIFFSFLFRTKDLRYVMNVEGPIPIQRTGDFRKDIEINTQNFVTRIEEEIRKQPSRWLWMHNRWRVAHGAKD